VREVEEAEEWVVEGASHGLADTTCFELYGFPNQAPPLSDSPNSKAQVRLRLLLLSGKLCCPAMCFRPSVMRAMCQPPRRAGLGGPQHEGPPLGRLHLPLVDRA